MICNKMKQQFTIQDFVINNLVNKFRGKKIVKGFFHKMRLKRRYSSRIDNWHYNNPIEWKPYVLDLVKQCNKLIKEHNLDTVVEVGCGLGEILAEIKAKTKVGYDNNLNLIIAAGELFKGIEFVHGSFDDVKNRKIDILIAVNFTHRIYPEELKSIFRKILANNDIRFIAVDKQIYTRSDNIKRYYHNFDEILPKCKRVFNSRVYQNHREVLIYLNHRVLKYGEG